MSEFKSYGPAGTDVSRPPVMTLQQMLRCLLHITGSDQVVFLPTGRVRTFENMRQWAGWEPAMRETFDQWAESDDRKAIESAPLPIVGQSTAQFNSPRITL